MLDGDGRPVPNTLVELWQANAAGRYRHAVDLHPAPLDPNFGGGGRCLTDDEGRYRFLTVKPGAYPWRNHPNAWRPAHIHFSLFGPAFSTRLVTQMYFPGDPLFYRPDLQLGPRPRRRERMVSRSTSAQTEPEWALGYAFDIVLRGPRGHADGGLRWRSPHARPRRSGRSSCLVLPFEGDERSSSRTRPDAVRLAGQVLDGEGEPVHRRPDRDLAGRPRRPLRPSGRPARGDPLRRASPASAAAARMPTAGTAS